MIRPVRTVRVTPDFEKSWKNLSKKIRRLATRKECWFRADAFDARLRTHRLKGHLDGYWSWSVNREYRILFRFLEADDVIFYDIGTHEIYR